MTDVYTIATRWYNITVIIIIMQTNFSKNLSNVISFLVNVNWPVNVKYLNTNSIQYSRVKDVWKVCYIMSLV